MNFKFDYFPKISLEKSKYRNSSVKDFDFFMATVLSQVCFSVILKIINPLDVLSLLFWFLTICNNILYAMHDGSKMASVQK